MSYLLLMQTSDTASGSGVKEPGLEVAWLNVLLGRITFDFLRQPQWAKWLCVKIQKKLDKIKVSPSAPILLLND